MSDVGTHLYDTGTGIWFTNIDMRIVEIEIFSMYQLLHDNYDTMYK